MNFLAHLVLAPQTPAGLVGALAPDLIRGPLPGDLDPGVRAAAIEHHRIDRATDTHPAFHTTRARLSEHLHRRYAGILADVLYDHVLATGWSGFRDDRLEAFIDDAERTLAEGADLMPPRMRVIVERMVGERWLASYATREGLRARLTTFSRRITRRLEREVDLVLDEPVLHAALPGVRQDFARLWPDLLACVARHRRDVASATSAHPDREPI